MGERYLTNEEKSFINRVYTGNPAQDAMDYSKLKIYDNSSIPADHANASHMPDQIHYPPNSSYYHSNIATQGDAYDKGLLIHEIQHELDAQFLGEPAYFTRLVREKAENPPHGDYDYSEFWDGEKTWQEMTLEERAQFMEHLVILEEGGSVPAGYPMNDINVTAADARAKIPADFWSRPTETDEGRYLRLKREQNSDNDGRTTDYDKVDEVGDDFGDSEKTSTPLIIDLGTSGIDLVDLVSNDFVYWDIDNDGFAEASGWVGDEDGLLAIDLNSDGKINNNSELFGSTEAEGFAELSLLDSNADGLINNADERFSDLLVWIDANGDAISETSELHSLNDLSINSIGLSNTRVDQTNAGNKITNIGTVTFSDTSTTDIVDAWFTYSDFNSHYIGDFTPDWDVVDLPSLKGYGNLYDLHIAMSNDNGTGGLKEQVEDINDLDFQALVTSETLYNDIRAILHRWAQVDAVSPTSRGEYIDARDLEFLEAFVGSDFLQLGSNPDPWWYATEVLDLAFNDLVNMAFGRLLLQSAGIELFSSTEVSYNMYTDALEDPGAIDSSSLSDVQTWATNATDALPIWQNVLRLLIGARGGVDNLSSGEINDLNNAIYASDNTLNYTAVIDSIFDTSSVTEFTGTASGETITGSLGDDEIDASDGDDTLIGDDGNDFLEGGSGSDTYIYNLGDGSDWIIEYQIATYEDIIEFGSGITSSDIELKRISNEDLQILINVSGYEGEIIVEGQFEDSSVSGGIETLVFTDMSEIDLTAINYTLTAFDSMDILYGIKYNGADQDTIYGLGGNDTIYGYTGADVLYGGDGDDTIYSGGPTPDSSYSQETVSNYLYGDAGNDYILGSYGTDYLYGGTGNDTLIGNEGDDEYYFELNGGNDTIDEVDQSDTDTIFFGAGIYEEDLSFVREGALSLRINIQGGLAGSILIVNQFGTTHADGGIEYVELDDTTQIYLPTLNYGLYGTSANETLIGLDSTTDIIFGEDGNDTLQGQTGSDELHGGNGNDTIYGGGPSSADYTETDTNYLYGNAGEDTIHGSYGTDHIHGGADDDYLAGTKGTDHYYFFRGEGDDTIEDKYTDATDDTIHFGSTISVSDITYERSGTADLKILINAGFGGSILLKNQFLAGSTYGVVEYLSFTDTTTVDLRTVNMTTYGTASGEYLYDVENNAGEDGTIYAGDGNDFLYGDDGEDTLYGEGGNDSLYGENDDDLLIGGDGDDLLRGGYGNDILRGGLGDDTLDGDQDTDTADYSQSATAVTIDLEDGDATGEGTDTLIQIENATGSAFDDTFVTSRYTNYVDGGDGIDTLDYSQTYYAASSITINLATGVTTGSGTSDTFDNIENVIGRAGGDNITGDDQANRLEGRNGTDTISGAGGNDLIYGGDGSDTLSGGDGNDVLYGGNGADSMTGGDGADIFAFLSGETGTKTITDFTTGDGDALDIADLLTGYDPGTDLITDFLEITDSGSDSIVRVDADGGADSFIQIAMLTGVTGLTDEEALETSGNLIAA